MLDDIIIMLCWEIWQARSGSRWRTASTGTWTRRAAICCVNYMCTCLYVPNLPMPILIHAPAYLLAYTQVCAPTNEYLLRAYPRAYMSTYMRAYAPCAHPARSTRVSSRVSPTRTRHAYAHYIYIYIYMYIYTCTYVCMYVYIYIYTHVHTCLMCEYVMLYYVIS